MTVDDYAIAETPSGVIVGLTPRDLTMAGSSQFIQRGNDMMYSERERFIYRSKNCMNRALEDIRRVGRLGDRFILADDEAEKMLSALKHEVSKAEKALQNRQPPKIKVDDEFTWDY